MMKLMYSAEEVNQILFDITLEKAKVEEKLEKIRQIIADYDGSAPSMITQFSKIQKVLEENN